MRTYAIKLTNEVPSTIQLVSVTVILQLEVEEETSH